MVAGSEKNDKAARLARLQRAIEASGVGADLRPGATQLVMGAGDLNAKIVLIGEAPGKKEDELGQPFVGASGRLLDSLLAEAGSERSKVYITNIVKYRPPNNRDPRPDEKAEFWPYLLKQLEIINPKIIITLGRHSGAAFFPELVISRDHGQRQQYQAPNINGGSNIWPIIPLYHPAAALYNPKMRPVLMADFQQAIKFSEH